MVERNLIIVGFPQSERETWVKIYLYPLMTGFILPEDL
jgi:hypothetical protein